MCVCIYIYIYNVMETAQNFNPPAGRCWTSVRSRRHVVYTRSPLEDSRLFGPGPWKILAATNEKKVPEQPSPWRKSCKRESCYGDRV